MTKEFSTSVENKGQTTRSNLKGRLRIGSLAFLSFVIASCTPASVSKPPIKDLNMYDIAKYCGQPQPPLGVLNPMLPQSEEMDILELVYDLEGHDKFPTIPQARSIFMYEDVAPVVSPDQKNIAYSSPDSQITIIDRNGNDQKRLTQPPRGTYDEAPVWSVDGHHLAFARRIPFQERSEIHIINSDGTNEIAITSTTANIWDDHPNFLNDGRVIYVERNDTNNRTDEGYITSDNLFIVKPDGSDKEQFDLGNSQFHTLEYYILSSDHSLVALNVGNNGSNMKFIPGGNGAQGLNDSTEFGLSVFDPKTGKMTILDTDMAEFLGVRWQGDDTYLNYDKGLTTGTRAYLSSVDGEKKYDCLPTGPEELDY